MAPGTGYCPARLIGRPAANPESPSARASPAESRQETPWPKPSASPSSSAACAPARTTAASRSRWRRLAPETFTFEHVAIGDLPLYNQDHDARPAGGDDPAQARGRARAGAALRDARVQPRHPGRAEERDRHRVAALGQELVRGQAAGVVGISVGAIGTALAQHQLRNVLAYLDVPTLGHRRRPEVHARDAGLRAERERDTAPRPTMSPRVAIVFQSAPTRSLPTFFSRLPSTGARDPGAGRSV